MNTMQLVLAILLTAIITLILAWFWVRRKVAEAQGLNAQLTELRATTQSAGARAEEARAQLEESQSRVQQLHEKTTALSSDLAAATARLEEERKATVAARDLAEKEAQRREDLTHEVASLKSKLSAAETKLQEEQKAAAEKLALLQEAEKKLTDTFVALSSKALKENNDSFLKLAKTQMERHQSEAGADLEKRQKAIEEIVKPIADSLQKVQANVQELEKSRVKAYTSLEEQVKSMSVVQAELHKEAGNLVKALRRPTVRGSWGEMHLKRAVEIAGMIEYCDFDTQSTVKAEDRKLRPDLIVHLPGGKVVVVDSKVPLEAYLAAMEAESDEQRLAKLDEHARQTRTHIESLGKKSYCDLLAETPEFVVCFIPGDAFYAAALDRDPSLIEFGVDRGVLLATPLTLIALLKSVAYGWRQERIAENAQAISELGSVLYERLRTLVGYFVGMKRGLDRAVENYNKAVGSLETRVLVAARRFRELGAANNNELDDPGIVDRSTRQIQAGDLLLPSGGDGSSHDVDLDASEETEEQ